jgi:hypothetical protein
MRWPRAILVMYLERALRDAGAAKAAGDGAVSG